MSNSTNIQTIIDEIIQVRKENTVKYIRAIEEEIIQLIKEKQPTIVCRFCPKNEFRDCFLGLVSDVNKNVSRKISLNECDRESFESMFATFQTGNSACTLFLSGDRIILKISG